MRKDDLIDSLGRIDDDLIQGVDALRRKQKSVGWLRWAGLTACCGLILAAVTATPGVFSEKPPVQIDYPAQTEINPPVETIHLQPMPVWTPYYNESEAMVSLDRACIQGIFTEELEEDQLESVKPDGLDCSGYAVYDHHGNLLNVILTVNTPTPVSIVMSSGSFGTCYLLDAEAVVSLCGDVEYRLYKYAYADNVHLGAETDIGGVCLHFSMETTPESLEQAMLDFQSVLECFAADPGGGPDLTVIVPEEIPVLTERVFETLSEARTEPDFGCYLPSELPDGFAESDIRRFQFDESNYLRALWSRGLDDLSWVVTPYAEADANRLTGVDELENYDLSRYPIPRAESVPEALWEIVDDPIFDAGELTLEAVYRRAWKAADAGDSDGWRMYFSVRYGDVLVCVSAKGVEPEWLYAQLKHIAEN